MSPVNRRVPDWQRAGGACAAGANLRTTVDDFRVTECMPVEPDGQGEHDWLYVEKRATNSAWLARQLAAHAGIAARDVGYAGMKDRHAVTRQWFSVRRPGGAATDWSGFNCPQVTLLEIERHSRKLKSGAHSSNRFELTLREVTGDPLPRLAALAVTGVPNYFGEQRFGRDGGNLALAASLFAGRRLKRDKRGIALSAARAWLFNKVVDARVTDGSWQQLLPGDIANLDGSHSVFAADEIDADLVRRTAELDLHPTGPLWGREGRSTGQHRLAAEQTVLRADEDFCRGLEQHCDAARRALRVRPDDLQYALHGTVLSLSFALPPGCYATVVLREFVNYRDVASAPAE